MQDSIHIYATLARVWELTLNVEAWPEYTPTFTKIELLDNHSITVGSTARIKQPLQRAKVWTVTLLEYRKRFSWTTRLMGTHITASHGLVENETGVINTLTIDIEGRLAPIIGALLRRPILKAMAVENLGFKTAAEN